MNLDDLKKNIDKWQGYVAEHQVAARRNTPNGNVMRDLILCEYFLLALNQLLISANDDEKAEINKQKLRVKNFLAALYPIALNENYVDELERSKEILKKFAAREFLSAAKNKCDNLLELGLMFDGVNIQPSLTLALAEVVKNKNNKFIKGLIAAGANAEELAKKPFGSRLMTLASRLMALVVSNDEAGIESLLLLQKHGGIAISGINEALLTASMKEKTTLGMLKILCEFEPSAIVTDVIIANAISVYEKNNSDINLEKIGFLLQKVSRDDYKTEAHLRQAVVKKNANPKLIRLLLQNGYQCTPQVFADALAYGSQLVISELNRYKNKVYSVDRDKEVEKQQFFAQTLELYKGYGFTEAMFYLVLGQYAAFQTLITNDQVANESQKGVTLLMMAARLGRVGFAEKLLSAGAKPNAGSLYERSALMYAVTMGSADLVKALLAKGADVNRTQHKDGKIETALSIALESNNAELVELLLSSDKIDLKLNDKEKDGATLMDLGLQSKNRTIQQAFRVKMAQSDIKLIEQRVNQEIRRLEVNAASCIGIGNMRKAKRITEALQRVKRDKSNLISADIFLNHKNDANDLSLMEALSSHRIGFFGKPKTAQNVLALVKGLRVGKR